MWCSICLDGDELLMQRCKKCSKKESAKQSAKRRRQIQDTCWSCSQGGLLEQCRRRRFEAKYHGCCVSCHQSRTCNSCQRFDDSLTLAWCILCTEMPAVWCSGCHPTDVLKMQHCLQCVAKISSTTTETLLRQQGQLPRKGEVLRFGESEWQNAHRVTHMLVIEPEHGKKVQYAITASTDNRVRVWNIRDGSLCTFVIMPNVNCRIDALTHCGGSFLLTVVTELASDVDSCAEDRETLNRSFRHMEDEGVCSRNKVSFRNPRSKCSCRRCKPDENYFHISVLLWNWTGDEITTLMRFTDELGVCRHSNMGPSILKGSRQFNRVFADVPVKITSVICTRKFDSSSFAWICGHSCLSLFETRFCGDGIVAETLTLASTADLADFIPPRCVFSVNALLWLAHTEVLVAAVRGSTWIQDGSIYDIEQGVGVCDAIGFQGCILIFGRQDSDFVHKRIVCEHGWITKIVDASRKHNMMERLEDIPFERECLPEDAFDAMREKWDPVLLNYKDYAEYQSDMSDWPLSFQSIRRAQEKLAEEQRYWYRSEAPILTCYVSALQRSASEDVFFALVPKTTEKQQMPRTVGPMVSNDGIDTDCFEVIGLRSLGSGFSFEKQYHNLVS